MKFDAVEKRKQEKKRTPKKVRKELARLNTVYPVVGYLGKGHVQTKIGSHEWVSLYLEVKPYDLSFLSDSEYHTVTTDYWAMHKRYAASLKEIYLAFPEDNQLQQEFVKRKLDKTTNLTHLSYLQEELRKLQHIEKHFVSQQSYLVLYGKTQAECDRLYKKLHSVANRLFDFKPFTKEKVARLFFLLNNTGGQLHD